MTPIPNPSPICPLKSAGQIGEGRTQYVLPRLPSAKRIQDVMKHLPVENVVSLGEQAAREAAADARWRGLDTAAKNAAYSTTEREREREREECARLGRPEYQTARLAREKQAKYRKWAQARKFEADRLERMKQEWLAEEIVKAWRFEVAPLSGQHAAIKGAFMERLTGNEQFDF